ncbi:MAG TPA: c-type cytochrome domain-containing protein, partial [Vicinamibacterales bacterium]
ECTAALATTVGKRGHWVVPEAQEASRLINPGHPESSAVVRRVKSRRPSSQMPPLGSVAVDKQAVDLLTSWVAAMKAPCGS